MSISGTSGEGVFLTIQHKRTWIGFATASTVVLVTLTDSVSLSLQLLLIGFAGAAIAAFLSLPYGGAKKLVGDASNAPKKCTAEGLDDVLTIAKLHQSVAETLVLAIDAREDNRGHVIRVQKYAERLSRALGFSQAEVEGIVVAGLLHDIGKLAVPDHLLKKQGALTAEEMAKMRLHAETGADMIKDVVFPYPVADAVRYHHERYDGSGYPSGLQGDDIPVAARVLAVVDSYESFIFRCDGQIGTADAAMAMLEKEAGVLFDPEIVATWASVHLEAHQLDKVDPAGESWGAYSDIHRATLEGHWLNTLSDAVSGLTSVAEIGLEATRTLEDNISPSTAFFWSVRDGQLVALGDEPVETNENSVPIGVGINGWVATEQSPSVNIDVNEGPFFGCKVVAVPVVFEGQTVGVISVYRGTEPFSDDEVRLVAATAERIRGSVHRAQVLENVRHEATYDRLTGLANRRLLDTRFKELDEGCFALVVFDIDEFKAVNDRFGHRAGDDVLVCVAQHMRKAFRGADAVCRLGGDEFVVLSQGSFFEAYKQVRLFREFVDADPDFEPYREYGFGVSWGIATAPTDGLTLDAVMVEADRRMYLTKARIKKERRGQIEYRDSAL